MRSPPLSLRVEDRSGELRPVDLALERQASSFTPENPLGDVTIPERLADGVEVGSSGIALGLASGTQLAEAAIVDTSNAAAGAIDSTTFGLASDAFGIDSWWVRRGTEC